MIEYPSIINSSKAPRKRCYAFEKLDGSNFRAKYTPKKGFHLFGSRHTLFDETHPHLGQAIPYFRSYHEAKLINLIKKEFTNEQEITVFGEFLGPTSFAGLHEPTEDKYVVIIDILVGKETKHPKFVLPQSFTKFSDKYELHTPKVVHIGNLTDQFIRDVRSGVYNVNEGVICKGTETSGAFRGGMWQCKIKTQAYLDKLRDRFGEEGVEKYGE